MASTWYTICQNGGYLLHVRLLQIARDVTRAITLLHQIYLDLQRSTEKYKRLADDMAESIDNYKKFTDLLTKSTGEPSLCNKKALYETEIKRARLDTLRGLKEINDAYEDQINVIGEVARIESLCLLAGKMIEWQI